MAGGPPRFFLSLTGILMAGLLLFPGCAQKKQRPGSEGESGITPGTSVPPPSIFPHPDDWATPSSHGVWVNQYGNPPCLGCHAIDSGTGSSPSCHSCHPLYPHPDDWVMPGNHGGAVLNEGKEGCQTACHGEDLSGGESGISCHLCHTIYPHGADWEETHGEETLSSGIILSCQNCHGSDYRRFLDGKNCFSCHPSFPHEEMPLQPWGQFEGHGSYGLLHSIEECRNCHGDNYQGGSFGAHSCFECHPSYPHLEGWLRPPGQPQGHGLYVNLNTQSSCATSHCHGVGLVPVPDVTHGPNCDGCHETYPHPAGWISGANHGPPAMANINICKACHAATLDFAPAGYQSCAQCHESYLQHETAQMGGDTWGTAAGHGQYVTVTLSGSFVPCKTCHGNDLTGGLSGHSCFTCHPGWPHDAIADWPGAGHGTLAVNLTVRNTCKDCHGADLLGGTSGISCWGCHTNFPHTTAWSQYQSEDVMTPDGCCESDDEGDYCWSCIVSFQRMYLHGEQFLLQMAAGFPASFNRCSNCHGANYQGGNSLVSCGTAACHPYYPHIAQAAWTAPPAAGSHGSAFLSGPPDLTSPCTKCHKNLGGGLEAVADSLAAANADACGSCHADYPHLRINQSPDSWLYRSGIPPGFSSWQYNHGWKSVLESYNESSSGIPSSCKDCHGADYHGEGVTEKNCSKGGCHSPPPREVSHGAPNWGPAAGHGKNYLAARLGGVTTETDDNAAPDVPDDCHDCHALASNRNPKVCNPFMAQFPGSATGWCNTCHKTPTAPVVCPCPGMNAATGACP